MQNRNKGLPSVEQPWLRYYSKEVQQAKLPEKTLFEYLFDNNSEQGGAAALDYFSRRISYNEMFREIRLAADGLIGLGIGKGDVVTIASMHTPETIYLIYALNYIGAVANLVYLTLPEDEMAANLRKTKSKAFFYLELIAEKAGALHTDIPMIALPLTRSMPLLTKTVTRWKVHPPVVGRRYSDWLRGRSDAAEMCPYEKDRPAVIVYTSGSTGKPKGVVLSDDNINALVFQYSLSGMNFDDGSTYLGIIPPFYGFGISVGIHLPLALGKELIIQLKPEPQEVAKAFARKKPNFFVSGPVFVEPILNAVQGDMSYMKIFAGGGESMAPEKEREVNALLAERGSVAKYVTGYGMTELAATVCTGMNHVYKVGAVGIPLPHVSMKIVDPDTQEELGYGQVGEVYIHSRSLMLGYDQEEQATADTICCDAEGRRWIRTGDLGCIDEDGFLYLKGRMKRIFIAKGAGGHIFKIFAQQVEDTVRMVDGVVDCAVLARKDPQREHIAVVCYSVKDGQDPLSEMKEVCRRKLPEHAIPAQYIQVEHLPYTGSGKIDYRALEESLHIT